MPERDNLLLSKPVLRYTLKNLFLDKENIAVFNLILVPSLPPPPDLN